MLEKRVISLTTDVVTAVVCVVFLVLLHGVEHGDLIHFSLPTSQQCDHRTTFSVTSVSMPSFWLQPVFHDVWCPYLTLWGRRITWRTPAVSETQHLTFPYVLFFFPVLPLSTNHKCRPEDWILIKRAKVGWLFKALVGKLAARACVEHMTLLAMVACSTPADYQQLEVGLFSFLVPI